MMDYCARFHEEMTASRDCQKCYIAQLESLGGIYAKDVPFEVNALSRRAYSHYVTAQTHLRLAIQTEEG